MYLLVQKYTVHFKKVFSLWNNINSNDDISLKYIGVLAISLKLNVIYEQVKDMEKMHWRLNLKMCEVN